MIDIREDLLKTVKSILTEHVPECEVRAFGSRVQWTAKDSSDLDIVVVGKEKLDWKKMAALKAAFEESKIPFRVDVLDWNAIPEDFRENIGKKFEVVQWGAAKGVASNGVREEAISFDNSPWTAKPLGEVFLINPSRKIEKGSESPYIAMDQLPTGNRTISHVERRVFSGSGSKFKNGDTLLARITPCLENGKTAFVNCLGTDEIAHGSTEFIVLSGKFNLSDNLFVYYFARSSEFRAYAISQMEGSSGRQCVPAITLEKYQINLPPLDTQRAIAHILGTLDDKIELNRRMNKTLEEIARAIYKSWFVDFDPVKKKAAGQPTGLPEEIEKLFPKEFEKSELGEIPRGWRVGKFCDIAANNRDQVNPKDIDASLPYVGLEHIPRGRIAIDAWGTVEEVTSTKFRFRKGQILFCKLRPYFEKVGAVPVDGICSTDILVLEPVNPYCFGLCLMVASSKEFISNSDSGSIGTKMPRTNWDLMSRFRIAYPILSELSTEFTSLIKTMVDAIFGNIYQDSILSNLRDTLLPRLLSGSLPIRDVEKFLKDSGL